MNIEFTEWPKTTRLFRDITITEKLDGSNAAIRIERLDQIEGPPSPIAVVGDGLGIWAQSRKKLIVPGSDNFGFARWVHDNAEELVALFDTGIHFGEWWGQGIQRGYGLKERRFSLFNTAAHEGIADKTELRIDIAPVLYVGVFSEASITYYLQMLKEHGSEAVPGFMDPEGICIFHSQSRIVQKVTLDNEDKGKWEV